MPSTGSLSTLTTPTSTRNSRLSGNQCSRITSYSQQEGGAKGGSTLTKEEKIQKAKELQEAIRKKRVEEDKRNAEEAEKMRIRMTKEISEAKRKLEEQQKLIAIEQQKREKMEFMSAKQQMLEQLRRDKEERFGKQFAGAAVEAEKPKPAGPQGIELVKHGLKTVRTIYTEDRQPGVAKTCFKTCHVYLGNVLKDREEEKYKRINLGNEAF